MCADQSRLKFYTVAEVADLLQTCTKTIRRRIDDGAITVFRDGAILRVSDDALKEYLKSREIQAQERARRPEPIPRYERTAYPRDSRVRPLPPRVRKRKGQTGT
jgi:excisionase family DNA binding protein